MGIREVPLLLCELAQKWRLTYDGVQWIVEQWTNTRSRGGWEQRRFFRMSSALRSQIAEMGIEPTVEALAMLSALPPLVTRYSPPEVRLSHNNGARV